jgi:hypothetical protein
VDIRFLGGSLLRAAETKRKGLWLGLGGEKAQGGGGDAVDDLDEGEGDGLLRGGFNMFGLCEYCLRMCAVQEKSRGLYEFYGSCLANNPGI